MLGSTLINHRQHVGLQQLSALAGITHSFLGPVKKYKSIQDDASGESTLVGSCFRVLENLELTCAVGQLVYETAGAHQRVYRTGTGCLLFLAGAWSRAALDCLQRGIPVAQIISAFSDGMEICLDVCRKSGVLTEGLGGERSKICTETPGSFGLNLQKKPIVESSRGLYHPKETRNGGSQRKLKLSRHFCQPEIDSREPHQLKLPDVAHIAERLSHGCTDAMNLVVEASRIQSQNNQDVGFDVSKVVTCVLPGLPEERACVLPGCVVLLSAEQAAVAHQLREQRLEVALIHGDLTHTYRHLGYKRPTGFKSVNDHVDSSKSSKEGEWMEKVVTLLLKLDVQLILSSGIVSGALVLRCCSHRILVVEKVKASVLKALADATGAVPVTYATQLNERCVGRGATVGLWRDLGGQDGKRLNPVHISTGGRCQLVSVILTSCVHAKLQALEDAFWACAYRVHHALRDGVLLPGAGATEMICVRRLRKQAEQQVTHPNGRGEEVQNPYTGDVLRLMADGFIDYVSTLVANTGRFPHFTARTVVIQQLEDCEETNVRRLFLAASSPVKSGDASEITIYDNLSVKQEAWRKALDVVFLVLQADAEIITGVDQIPEGAQEDWMLL
ncbi:Bardet-Biedl syndrome 12 protein [Antennarius striatus]|uniref:Bardet-Biedl syndrome 12 protein n=1 Tax=Antennarius striatus TaxID=241820 RepID=UPI0035B21D58